MSKDQHDSSRSGHQSKQRQNCQQRGQQKEKHAKNDSGQDDRQDCVADAARLPPADKTRNQRAYQRKPKQQY